MPSPKATILADLPGKLSRPSWRNPAVLLVGAVSLVSVVIATANVPGQTSQVSTQFVSEQLPRPSASFAEHVVLPFAREENIRSGDSIHAILRRLGVSDERAVEQLLGSPEGKAALRQLRAGRTVRGLVGQDGRLHELRLPIAQGNDQLVLQRADSGEVNIRVQAISTETMVEMRTGIITHSLFGATDAAGLPDKIANRLADLFGTEIDFHTDLRKGDRFAVVYEAIYDSGTLVGTGRILAAEFENDGKRHLVALFKNKEGQEEFFSAEGRSLKQGFLRSPLEFSRVTSGFGKRLHPIFQNWRSHNGVDFGAPTGTPVKASSDGQVEFAGTQSGYGNIVILRHRGRYSTAYAHLNGFAKSLSKGQRISQGDVIGYVGATGWATGPHLHYEVRVDNVPQDPMNVALPAVEPLTGGELDRFSKSAQPLFQRISLMNNTSKQLAAKD